MHIFLSVLFGIVAVGAGLLAMCLVNVSAASDVKLRELGKTRKDVKKGEIENES